MKKLFFVYTNPSFLTELYRPVMSRAFDSRQDVQVCFAMDNSVLLDTLENHVVPTASVKSRLYNLLRNCVEAGADCIVVGCTAINTAVKELALLFEVPVISIEEEAVCRIISDNRKKIAVLSHTEVNAFTIERRLHQEVPKLEVVLFVADTEGCKPGSDKFLKNIKEKAETIPADFDAVILGHITGEDVDYSNVTLPIYKTGETTVEAIKKRLGLP